MTVFEIRNEGGFAAAEAFLIGRLVFRPGRRVGRSYRGRFSPLSSSQPPLLQIVRFATVSVCCVVPGVALHQAEGARMNQIPALATTVVPGLLDS